MYGFQPRSPITVVSTTKKIQQVKYFFQDHMDMLRLAHQNVKQPQDHYWKFANTKQRIVSLKEGDLVFLCVLNHSQSLNKSFVDPLRFWEKKG